MALIRANTSGRIFPRRGRTPSCDSLLPVSVVPRLSAADLVVGANRPPAPDHSGDAVGAFIGRGARLLAGYRLRRHRFPESVATAAGIDLSQAPTGSAAGVGLQSLTLRFAEVTLRIADSQEQREWSAWVGFTTAKLRQPLLGHAGFLQFFDALVRGADEVVELTVNGSYRGT